MEGKHVGQDSPRGWLVVLGCFFAQVAVFGNVNSFGIYQERYKAELFTSSSHVQVTLIGALQGFMLLSGGLWVPSFSAWLGLRKTVILGGLIQGLGHLLASFLTPYLWCFYLTQGLLVGLGSSLIFFPLLPLPPQWFFKHRGLANGLSVLGSGLGSLALSPLINLLLQNLGYALTLRIMTGILMIVVLLAVALVKELTPSDAMKKKGMALGRVLGRLKDRKVICLALFMLAGNFAYFAVLFFLPSYASFIGLDSATGALLVSVLMGFNAIACVSIGWVADRVGRLLMLILCNLAAALSCGLLWPFARSFLPLLIFVIIFGCAIGGFLNLPAVVIAEVVPPDALDEVLGLLFSFNSVGGVVGPPLLGWLLDLTQGRSFLPAQFYAAACFLAAVGALLCLRWFLRPTRVAVA